MTPLAKKAALAASAGLGTFVWYAMPDAVRSRPLRTLVKSTLLALGGTVAYLAGPPPEPHNGPDAVDEALFAVNQHPVRYLALGGGALAASVAATVWGEKAIHRFGERRRDRGVRGAHAVPALALGALAGALMVADPPQGTAPVA